VGVRLEATTLPCNTGVCIVISGRRDRGFITNYGAAALFAAEHVRLAELAQCSHLHVGGLFSTTALQRQLGCLLRELRELRPSITVSLDTNFDATGDWGWEGDEAAPQKTNWLVSEILPEIDVFLPNEIEAMGISRAASVEESLTWLAPRLRKGGLVVVTTGEDGAVARRGEDEEWSTPAFEPPRGVKDTTGAGDCFNAGFLSFFLDHPDDVQGSLEFGCGAGAIAVGRVGACDHPVERGAVAALASTAAAAAAAEAEVQTLIK